MAIFIGAIQGFIMPDLAATMMGTFGRGGLLLDSLSDSLSYELDSLSLLPDLLFVPTTWIFP
jgi:hypothetical protein